MAGVNKVILVGHLGRDPEIRYTADGTPVANFSIATSETWKDKNTGERQERTEWHRIVVWRQLAEICGKYLSKGRQVYIEGKLQTREWEDRDGNKRWTTEVVASDMVMLGSREGYGQQGQASGGYGGQSVPGGGYGGGRQGGGNQGGGNQDGGYNQGRQGGQNQGGGGYSGPEPGGYDGPGPDNEEDIPF